MSEASPVRGVLLAHGGMARGMVDAVRGISGAEEGVLVPLSNQGKSPETLHEELSELLRVGPTIIFTDLASGSCAFSAQLCCRADNSHAVISGVNLAILLDFVFNRDLPMEELVPRLLEKGRTGVRSFPGSSDHAHRPLSG